MSVYIVYIFAVHNIHSSILTDLNCAGLGSVGHTIGILQAKPNNQMIHIFRQNQRIKCRRFSDYQAKPNNQMPEIFTKDQMSFRVHSPGNAHPTPRA